MKHYELLAWPDLPAAFHHTAYLRMLHQMWHRYASVPQPMRDSGLARGAVLQTLDKRAERHLLKEREHGAPESRFGHLRPIAWLLLTFAAEESR